MKLGAYSGGADMQKWGGWSTLILTFVAIYITVKPTLYWSQICK